MVNGDIVFFVFVRGDAYDVDSAYYFCSVVGGRYDVGEWCKNGWYICVRYHIYGTYYPSCNEATNIGDGDGE